MIQQKYHILYVEYYVTVYVEYIRLYVNRRKAWGGRPPQGLGGGPPAPPWATAAAGNKSCQAGERFLWTNISFIK